MVGFVDELANIATNMPADFIKTVTSPARDAAILNDPKASTADRYAAAKRLNPSGTEPVTPDSRSYRPTQSDKDQMAAYQFMQQVDTQLTQMAAADPAGMAALVQAYNAGTAPAFFTDFVARRAPDFRDGFQGTVPAPGQLTAPMLQTAAKVRLDFTSPSHFDAFMADVAKHAADVAPLVIGYMTGGALTPSLGATGGAMAGGAAAGGSNAAIQGGSLNDILTGAGTGAAIGGIGQVALSGGNVSFGPAATANAPLPPGGMTATGNVPPLTGPLEPLPYTSANPVGSAVAGAGAGAIPGVTAPLTDPTAGTPFSPTQIALGPTAATGIGNLIPSTGNAAVDAAIANQVGGAVNGGGGSGGSTGGGSGGGLMSGNFDWLGQLLMNQQNPVAINKVVNTNQTQSGGDVSALRTLLTAMQPLSTAQGMDANIRQIYQQGFEAQMPSLYNASAGAGFDPVASSIQQLRVNDLNARLAGTAAQALTQQQTATGAVAEALAKNSGGTTTVGETTDYQIDPMAALLLAVGSLGTPLQSSGSGGNGGSSSDPLANIRNLLGL